MWCSKCGKQLEDGAKFCDVCGTKVEDGETFILPENNNEWNMGNNVYPENPYPENTPPVIPQYEPNDYIENKAQKASKSKAGYFVILAICIIVIAASAGVIGYVLLSDSDSSSKKNRTSISDEDEGDDEGDGEEEDTKTSDSAKGSGKTGKIDDSFDDDTDKKPGPQYAGPAEDDTDAYGTEIEEPVEEEPVEEEPEYILEGSDRRRISESELYDMDEFTCKLAMNELYARHGRMFDTPEIQEYFNTKDWYHGEISASEWQNGKYDSKYFNDYEIYNRDLIAEYQKSMGWRK